jgi:hypothetical protein
MRCCRPDGYYAPGETLACTWQIENLSPDSLLGLEASILWHTEGKGDEDLAVHFFHRWSANRLQELNLALPQRFSTRLPASPQTYDGHLFRIRWCARLRLFLSSGAEIVAEQPLTLLPRTAF